MAAGDSDDALVCCVENTVEDRIMDFGASFHATYCKGELESFKLHSGKDVRLGDISKIGISMLASKGNSSDVRKVDIYFYKPGGLGKQKNLSFIMSVKTRKLQRSCGRSNAYLQVKCLKFDNGGEYSNSLFKFCVGPLNSTDLYPLILYKGFRNLR
nr:hypothetical protein [Tanacetum cinerariifolium]